MSRLKEIHSYLVSIGTTQEELHNIYDFVPEMLAKEIAIYAHRNQRRENGEGYVNHPLRIKENICKLHYEANDETYKGIEVLALLHDVIEDTDFTIDDIKEIFEENKLGEFFDKYIKEELLALTHNEEEDYEVYIKRIMQYSKSSLVKLSDLCDNLNLLTLNSFDVKEYERCEKYLKYAYYINGKYHFIEQFAKYASKEKEVTID